MFGVIVAALRTILGWLLGQAVLKGIVLTVFAAVVAFIGEWLFGLLPSYLEAAGLNMALVSLPPGVWWLLDLFRFSYGAPLLLSAAVVGFLIRRLPVVG